MVLNLDWQTIGVQILNFLAFYGALYFLLFKPLLRRVEERKEEQRQLRQELLQEHDEAERLRQNLERRLEDAEEEADEIITQAREQAEAERQRMLEEVEGRIDQILKDARADAQQMRERALEDFHAELVDAILDVSAQVIGQAAPPEVHERLVDQLSERIWEMGRSEMERVEAFRRSLGERTPTANVTVAQSLTAEQQGELARTLSALADRNVDLEITTDPSLAAGIRVRIADMVVENSITGRLDALRDRVSKALKERTSNE